MVYSRDDAQRVPVRHRNVKNGSFIGARTGVSGMLHIVDVPGVVDDPRAEVPHAHLSALSAQSCTSLGSCSLLSTQQ